MFYCSDCARKNNWHISLFQSHGLCEICGKTGRCSDVKSSDLPILKEKDNK